MEAIFFYISSNCFRYHYLFWNVTVFIVPRQYFCFHFLDKLWWNIEHIFCRNGIGHSVHTTYILLYICAYIYEHICEWYMLYRAHKHILYRQYMLKHILDECILCTHIFCTNNSIVIKLIWINTTEVVLGFLILIVRQIFLAVNM